VPWHDEKVFDRCVVCGRALGLVWAVDHLGEKLCQRCLSGPRCLGCDGATGGTAERSQTTLPDGRVRCQRCSRGAVDTSTDVNAVVKLVRPLLQSFGIRLVNRVKVELTTTAELHRQVGSHAQGFTMIQPANGYGSTRVLALRIVDGLPATLFGSVLAHEMGHAWLAGCPGPRDAPTEEGLCELVASWWLHQRGGKLAAHILNKMNVNPDPVYGAGYREARQRAGAHRPAEVVARVQRRGQL
jgi:hypothetical protein